MGNKKFSYGLYTRKNSIVNNISIQKWRQMFHQSNNTVGQGDNIILNRITYTFNSALTWPFKSTFFLLFIIERNTSMVYSSQSIVKRQMNYFLVLNIIMHMGYWLSNYKYQYLRFDALTDFSNLEKWWNKAHVEFFLLDFEFISLSQ